MGTQAAADTLKKLVQTDLARGAQSRINLFLTGAGRGGWEPWLQVEAALQLSADNKTALAFLYEREVPYPGVAPPRQCDLRISPDPAPPAGKSPGRGAPIWIELKTQRSAGYANTIKDLSDDIDKLGLNVAMKDQMFVAAAVLLANGNTGKELKDLAAKISHASKLTISLLRAGGWKDQARPDDVLANDIVLATWINTIS